MRRSPCLLAAGLVALATALAACQREGPAERAGLQVGDVLLALNGHSASGAHALRAFMGADRIGTQIEVRLLRDGVVMLANVVVAEQPAY